MGINNDWIYTVKRTQLGNIDGQMVMDLNTVGDDVPATVQIGDTRYLMKDSTAPKVYHPEFRIMTQYVDNNVFYSGTARFYYTWLPEQDEDISYLEANIESSDEIRRALKYDYLTDMVFDWDNRTVNSYFDAALRPRNIWIDDHLLWIIDGHPFGYVTSDPNYACTCFLAKEPFAWNMISCNLEDGENISYTKPEGIDTYLLIAQNDAVINGRPIAENTPLKVSSSQLNIETAGNGEVVIVVKEKVYEGRENMG